MSNISQPDLDTSVSLRVHFKMDSYKSFTSIREQFEAKAKTKPIKYTLKIVDQHIWLGISKKQQKIYSPNLHLEFTEEAEIDFYGDQNLFKQLLRIFLDNAIKFASKKGKIRLKIDKVDSDNFYFSVEDDGPGISQADLPFVFDRFYQADKSRSRKENT